MGPPWLRSLGDSGIATFLEASWAEGWWVIFKLGKLNGKGANLNSYDLLRSLPAPRCYQRMLHMHIHMHSLLYKNVHTNMECVTIYINEYCIHTCKHKALEMHSAKAIQRPMSCSAAAAGTHRRYWQI